MPISKRARRSLAHPLRALRILRKRFLLSPRLVRTPELYAAVGSWTFGAAPRVPLPAIFPGIESARVVLERAFDRRPGTSLEPSELLSLCAIARFVDARTILEVGTFEGHTALNLAANTPDDARVFTVDLPPDWEGDLALPVPDHMVHSPSAARSRRQYGAGPLAAKITQILSDSARLDWESLPASLDLAFIDGCHAYDYVRHDSARALERLAPEGVLVWHDYGMIEDVSRAVDELSGRLDIQAVRGTRLAVGRRLAAARRRSGSHAQ